MGKPDLEKVPAFYRGYVEIIPDGKELLPAMIETRDEFIKLLEQIDDEQGVNSYSPQKWSIKELISHICDAERIFGYRALTFGRGDLTDLPGFEQDDYVKNSRSNERPMEELRREFTNVRNSSIDLFHSFNKKELARFGSANGFRIDVNTLGYILVGHMCHHQNILETKYLD